VITIAYLYLALFMNTSHLVQLATIDSLRADRLSWIDPEFLVSSTHGSITAIQALKEQEPFLLDHYHPDQIFYDHDEKEILSGQFKISQNEKVHLLDFPFTDILDQLELSDGLSHNYELSRVHRQEDLLILTYRYRPDRSRRRQSSTENPPLFLLASLRLEDLSILDCTTSNRSILISEGPSGQLAVLGENQWIVSNGQFREHPHPSVRPYRWIKLDVERDLVYNDKGQIKMLLDGVEHEAFTSFPLGRISNLTWTDFESGYFVLDSTELVRFSIAVNRFEYESIWKSEYPILSLATHENLLALGQGSPMAKVYIFKYVD